MHLYGIVESLDPIAPVEVECGNQMVGVEIILEQLAVQGNLLGNLILAEYGFLVLRSLIITRDKLTLCHFFQRFPRAGRRFSIFLTVEFCEIAR